MNMPALPEVRRKIISDAMQEKAPKMYAELKASGKLLAFLKEQDKQMCLEYLDLQRTSTERLLSEKKSAQTPYLQTVQELNQAMSANTEQAIADWTDFADPETSEPIIALEEEETMAGSTAAPASTPVETFTAISGGRIVWISTAPGRPAKFGVFKDGAWTKESWSMASLMEGTPLSKEAIADLKAKGMPDK